MEQVNIVFNRFYWTRVPKFFSPRASMLCSGGTESAILKGQKK